MGGISSATSGAYLYGTDGYVTVNSTDIGSTIGNIKMEWSMTHYYPNIAQARGPVATTGRVTEATFKVMVTIAEWQWTNLSALCGDMGTSSAAGSFAFGIGNIGSINEVSNVIVTGISRNDAVPFYVKIPTAYIELGGVELAEDKETTMEITFNGLYTLTNPKKFPGTIQFGGT